MFEPCNHRCPHCCPVELTFDPKTHNQMFADLIGSKAGTKIRVEGTGKNTHFRWTESNLTLFEDYDGGGMVCIKRGTGEQISGGLIINHYVTGISLIRRIEVAL